MGAVLFVERGQMRKLKKIIITTAVVLLFWFLAIGSLILRVINDSESHEGQSIATYYTTDSVRHYNVRAPENVKININATGYDYVYYPDHVDLILHYERLDNTNGL